MANLKIKVILGTVRQARFSEQSAKWTMERLKNIEGLEVELLDLKNYPLPFFEEPVSPSAIKEPYANPMVKKWTDKIAEGDAYIIVTPEYNHGYTGVLKNAIDYVGKQWNRKPVAFVSHGTVGGARAVEQLRPVFAELQMVSIRTAIHLIAPWTLPNENGILKPGVLDSYNDNFKTMLDQLVWWGNALKVARGNQ